MKLIKTYNNYITENKEELVLTDDQLIDYVGKYYDFLKDYFKDNPAIKITESAIMNGYSLDITNRNPNSELMLLTLDITINNTLDINSLQTDDLSYYLYNTETNFEIIKQYLDSYYDILAIQTEYTNVLLHEIPVVNVDKYIDFLYGIYLNFNKYDFLWSLYNKEKILEEIKELDVLDYIVINDKFEEKFEHILNASNFDLI